MLQLVLETSGIPVTGTSTTTKGSTINDPGGGGGGKSHGLLSQRACSGPSTHLIDGLPVKCILVGSRTVLGIIE